MMQTNELFNYAKLYTFLIIFLLLNTTNYEPRVKFSSIHVWPK